MKALIYQVLGKKGVDSMETPKYDFSISIGHKLF